MTTALSSPPVLPEHVKKPNEEEFKKTIESINASIEKIQKQFVSFFFKTKTSSSHTNTGCCQGKNHQVTCQRRQLASWGNQEWTCRDSWKTSRIEKESQGSVRTVGCVEWIHPKEGNSGTVFSLSGESSLDVARFRLSRASKVRFLIEVQKK